MNPLYINLKINPNLYSKDPVKTDLGKKIIENSVLLLDEIGLESFTFKKLSQKIGSTEASIYRYFENKHQLFVYLLNWYWEWIAVRIDLNTLNIKSKEEQLEIALCMVVDSANTNTAIEFVDEEVLHRMVVREGSKGYHHKLVDAENDEGFFLAYKNLCNKISDLIIAINPTFKYPRTLASTLVEMGSNNLYYAKHLPRLSDLDGESENLVNDTHEMLKEFAFKMIKKEMKAQSKNPSKNGVTSN